MLTLHLCSSGSNLWGAFETALEACCQLKTTFKGFRQMLRERKGASVCPIRGHWFALEANQWFFTRSKQKKNWVSGQTLTLFRRNPTWWTLPLTLRRWVGPGCGGSRSFQDSSGQESKLNFRFLLVPCVKKYTNTLCRVLQSSVFTIKALEH